MKKYGYHRTSRREQHLDRGITEITAYCEQNQLELEKIYTGQQTGKNFNRQRYQVLKGYCKDDYRVTNNDVEIPTYLERDLSLEFEKLKQYGLVSNYCYYISGCWEITILPSLLTYFERKEKAILQEK